MTFYCNSHTCLRAYILRYFGETTMLFVENVPTANRIFQVDATREAKSILTVVYRLAQRRQQYGKP
jgi:ATP-dependent DNA helicase RecQ